MLLAIAGCKNPPNAMLRQRGYEALDMRERERAFALFSRAVKQDPTDWKAQLYYGKILNTRGRPLDAQLALERSLVLRPNHPETPQIIDELAESLFLQHRYEQLHDLLASVASENMTVHGYLRQGEYLARMKEIDGARVAYTKAAAFAKPNDVGPYLKMVTFYKTIGDTAGEIKTLRYAHYIRPTDPGIANKLREHGIVPGPAAALNPKAQ